MSLISSLLEFFLLSLSLGVCFFYFLVPVKKTGEGFIKLMCSLNGAATFLGLVTRAVSGGTLTPTLITLYAISTIAFGLMYLLQREQRTVFIWLLYFIQVFSQLGLFWLIGNQVWQDYSYNVVSVLFLGSIMFAMVLGHWYLVVPKLSEVPLKHTHYFMWPLLGIKLALTAVIFYRHYDFFEMGTSQGGGFSFNWLMLTMRVGWGYLVIGVMSIFSWKLVAMRSIQSATGMLYAMVFFVFVGELIAQFFFMKYGLML